MASPSLFGEAPRMIAATRTAIGWSNYATREQDTVLSTGIGTGPRATALFWNSGGEGSPAGKRFCGHGSRMLYKLRGAGA